MRFLSISSFSCVLTFFLTLYSLTGFGQGDPKFLNKHSFQLLEKSIREKSQLLQVEQQLEAVKRQSIQSHNYISLARSLYDLMKIRDLRTEDTLYFRNSAVIDTLLENKATWPELKSILYLMRAQRIGRFDSRPRRFNEAAYRIKSLKPDYAAMDRKQRDSIIDANLHVALKSPDFKASGDKLLWLSSNPEVFLFSPSFQDIVLSERINLLELKRHLNDEGSKNFQGWLSLSSAGFLNKLDSLALYPKNKTDVLVAYHSWLLSHKSEPETYSFIESLTRKYIYLSVPSDSVIRQAYVRYLQQCIASPYSLAKAHAVYQLCLIFNEEGNKYARFGDRYNYYLPSSKFDPQYQFYPAKALQLYELHKNLMYQYPVFNKVLNLMVQQIRSAGVRIEMENQHLPGDAIPIRVIYKNTDSLFYRIIRIGADEHSGNGRVHATAQLLNRQPLAQGNFALPLPTDHNSHATYLKLPALPSGHYRLLFNYLPIKVDGYDLNNLAFEVTSITAVNTDEKIFILDKKTGFPLSGARIRAFKKGTAINAVALKNIDKRGYINIADGVADSLNITYNGDTTGYQFSIRNNDLRDDVYNKVDYDDLAEFYDDKLKMEIFTDRSIYRPGQTVHYKIIFLTNDSNTGNRILFNSENVGSTVLKNWLKNKLTYANNKITLNDPFRKKIDSTALKINEFGSFAGSFIIPKTAATGNWRIDGSLGTDYQNSGEFSVEEYKRPTIELSMEKQKKMLLPGEPFIIKLKLRSFSGADLGNIPITYTLNRSGSIPSTNTESVNYASKYITMQLLRQTGYTDEKGELSMAVNDTILAKTRLTDTKVWNYDYNINATAVDATGESTEINESVNISSRPVKINIPLSKTYDRQAIPILSVNTSADFEGEAGRKVNVKLYKTNNPDADKHPNKEVDQWYFKEAEWNTWFPDKATSPAVKQKKVLVLDTIINTAAYEKLLLRKEKVTTGFYQLVATTQNDNNRTIGQLSYNFNVFDSKTGDTPVDDIDYLLFNTAKPGDVLTWYSSGRKKNYTIYQILYVDGKRKKTVKNIYQTVTEMPGVRLWKYQIPDHATGQLVLNRITVSNNHIYKHEKTVYVTSVSGLAPDIIVEKYRKVMAPGAQETFKISIKTQNNNVAAELMTTLYDASLDKLEEHRWNLPNTADANHYLNTYWGYALTTTKRAGNYTEETERVTLRDIGVPPTDMLYSELRGRVPGLSITSASGLNEVVVLGYGTVQLRELTASTASLVTLRGASTIQDYKQPLIILDGEVFNGDLNSINASAITQALILKGADASALYGSRAAQGVLIISTKGPIVLPGNEEPVVKVRKNFNETAFFYPQVHADKDGFYTFSFTMPETATEWNWKMLAHTRKSQFAYLEKKLQTQLNLMVQPHMPRLLYQGDKIKLQSRISNLDTMAIQGKVTCKIEDAVTGEDITAVMTNQTWQSFNLNRKSSGAVSFMLQVPAQQTNPLKVVISAVSGNAADAEEHILPVLSKRIFVRQSQPVHFENQPAVTISPIKLPADATLQGLSISIAQKPQASLIYALPWLANYSYNCAEQIFNKLRAQVTALRLMQKDTAAQSAFNKASAFIQKEDTNREQLPDELADETMPWLAMSRHTAHQQKQLFHLLDTNVSKVTIDKHLDKLYQLQQPDGGLTWFEGGESNAYISAYILAGFGQLKQMGWHPAARRVKLHNAFIERLYRYHQNLLSTSALDSYSNLFQLYAMSYWNKDYPLSDQQLQKVNQVLTTRFQKINTVDLAQQALLIINTLKYTATGYSLNQKARRQLDDIRQQAIVDEPNGLRWKDIADAEEMNSSAEETMALLAEAFELSGLHKEVQPGILKWLLATKSEEHWQTTKATAAAIDMLQKEKGETLGKVKVFSAQLAGQRLSVSDGLLDGQPVAFTPVKELPQNISLHTAETDVNGALTWYYFAEPIKLDTLNKAIKVSKQFYVYNNDKGWVPFTSNTILKAGDKVQVKLSVETASRLTFVHINDPRAAAFEPKETKSGYHYSGGLGYYQSIRDTGLDLFAEAIPRGISEITYELIVAHDGEFTSGPATLQCMYKPALTAYSSTEKVKAD
ncbi:MG2 domain-containing protein [Mucilaginibacter lacusdianchii]|uniref:alpha-2-macroglobulin family protein n=1 Tax=Mucilaginibacter lacusdianchii TaxID=2684211 RepID=UPI00131B3952|nr:MG2 domain-containing protein [Mucilaginibacter sp. JXJ CY 39]